LPKALAFRLATSGNPIGNTANITHILISHFLQRLASQRGLSAGTANKNNIGIFA